MGIWSKPKDGADAFTKQLAINRRFGDDSAQRIADRMQCCPNNPRHGGKGYDNAGRFFGFDVDDTETARRLNAR